ncbi:long-chain fatty acid--CoA ligase [Halalkalibacillus sediminis]|uniref:Long-chain fatty acid--CoA ligase n=1 Tax=Halalkalibacillus sediminis TaxID=2018042 RepID=A0A2I0QRD9_9BACI|nr:AMP-binding protein [Halalkalibacillus sediminis]PKR76898.1 long-chain fatty acid--CoA ligase [Halalkalibacillus sediminis]
MHKEFDWISSRAILYPNDIAIIDATTDDRWTYSEVDRRAEVLATHFVNQGIKKGDRVALLAPNHISYLDFLFAAMKCGAIFVPLNWRLSEEELSYVLGDAEPTLVGVHESFHRTHEWLGVFGQALEIAGNSYIDQLPTYTENIFQKPEIDDKDPLAMVYTGGTTGKPKGAVLSHQSIFWNAMNTIVSWDLKRDECTLTSIPMFHTGGLNALTTPILLAGGTVVLESDFEPEKAVKNLIKYRCTIVLFIPTMYHMIVQTDAFQEATFYDMEVFLSGGAPCPLSVYEEFNRKGLSFKEGYGLTEAGPNNFYIDPEMSKVKQGSVGQEMLFNEIRIVRSDGEEVATNEVGELWLKGKHLFEYYWKNDEETADSFQGEWFVTGDLARKDEDGYVYISGRKKEMIITGGENVYPLEIEHWLQSNEKVDEVAVVGIPDDKWGEKVAAFVSVKSEDVTEEELIRFCELKLSKYKIPKEFVLMAELPKTHVGKIDKKALLDDYAITE